LFKQKGLVAVALFNFVGIIDIARGMINLTANVPLFCGWGAGCRGWATGSANSNFQLVFQEGFMKEKRNLHLKVQEMADCYATSDPLNEMATLSRETDLEQAAVKWLALAVLHGINNNAEKITIRSGQDGRVQVTAEYRPSELPAPSADIAAAVVQTVREITHIEGDKGKLPLSVGIRDSSTTIKVKLKAKDDGTKISLSFD
jgi:hypothetical protein